jgi:hypothetical protein
MNGSSHEGLRPEPGLPLDRGRRPAPPQIEILSGAPTSAEVAAVVTAIEQLLAERDASPQQSRTTAVSGWGRAALLAGVTAAPSAGERWGLPPRADNG